MSNSAPHKVVMPDRCQDFFFWGGGGDWLWGLILTAQVFKFWCSFFPNNPPNQTISHTKQERKNTKKTQQEKPPKPPLKTRPIVYFRQIVSWTLSGLFLVSALNRPRKREKGRIGKIPGPSPSKSGKSGKNRESPKKDKKGRTSPDRETPPV